jgi:UDP-glucose 4-epimerase
VCLSRATQIKPEDGKTLLLREEYADPSRPDALPRTAVRLGELMGEMTLKAHWKQHGLKSVCCRLFTAYGERENETHAVIALIAKAFIRMDPYEIWGDGQQDRNFTYVGDIVDGMIRASERIDDASAVNIGTSEHIRIIDAVRMIFDEMDFQPERFAFDTTKPVGVYSRAADLTRAEAFLAGSLRRPSRRVAADDRVVQVGTPEDVKARLSTLLTER